MEANDSWEKNFTQKCTSLQGSYDIIIPTECIGANKANERANFTPRVLFKDLNDQVNQIGRSKPESESRHWLENRVSWTPTISAEEDSSKLKKHPPLRSSPLTEPLSLPTVSVSQVTDKAIYLAPEGTVVEGSIQTGGNRKRMRQRLPGGNLTEGTISIEDLWELNRFSQHYKLTTEVDARAINCQVHSKCIQPIKSQRLLYATNQHGHVYTGYQRHQSRMDEDRSIQESRDSTCMKEDRIPVVSMSTCVKEDRIQVTRRLPQLPQTMSSEEYTQSWLTHGSIPQGQSHFPNIH